LEKWHVSEGRGEFTINQRWITARQLLEDARKLELRLPILFAPAEDTKSIFGWGEIKTLELIAGHTNVVVQNFKIIIRQFRKTSLKKHNGENIDRFFVRPYAICLTPKNLASLEVFSRAYVRAGEERTKFPEGCAVKITVDRYERDREARNECIRLHGLKCAACEMSFLSTYGDPAKNVIHVHHLEPLRRGNRRTDPRKDLVPICPNCHAVVHLRTPPYEIADVRQMLSRTAQTGSE
jgi:hypothetical protein